MRKLIDRSRSHWAMQIVVAAETDFCGLQADLHLVEIWAAVSRWAICSILDVGGRVIIIDVSLFSIGSAPRNRRQRQRFALFARC